PPADAKAPTRVASPAASRLSRCEVTGRTSLSGIWVARGYKAWGDLSNRARRATDAIIGCVADGRTTPEQLTAAAVRSFAGCPDERLRSIMEALVRHLHAFAAEVGLTQDEWMQAIRILTDTGH